VQHVYCSPDFLLARFFFQGEHNPILIFITGSSGAGKTSWCAHTAQQARAEGLTVSGLLCPAVFSQGEKVGIDLVDLATGERQRLGIREDAKNKGIQVGCWYLDPATLAWGNEILRQLDHADLVILDEIGLLEFEHGAGFQEGLRLLDEVRYKMALVVVRPTLLPAARARWPHAQVLDLGEGAS
jgi:nucleoside-triphosphatase THEP1